AFTYVKADLICRTSGQLGLPANQSCESESSLSGFDDLEVPDAVGSAMVGEDHAVEHRVGVLVDMKGAKSEGWPGCDAPVASDGAESGEFTDNQFMVVDHV